jgi:2,5-diamino-6-(ribosylamino)-4(3H)-pyrimidinone 5'-phosphate reductase
MGIRKSVEMIKQVKRPHAFMLVAVSLDGKIAPRRRPGQPNPVGPALIDPAIMQLHNEQRAGADAIMVGLNCIRLDDSRLTLREGSGRNPVRIVLDGLAEMPPTAKVLGPDASTIVAVTRDAPAERVAAFQTRGAQIITAGRGRFVDLPRLMKALYEECGIRRLLVEGGGTVHRSMIECGLYSELHLILCPFVIGGASSITPVQRGAFWPRKEIPRYRLERADRQGDYLYIVYRPDKFAGGSP